MARQDGIPYEEVARVCDALRAQGTRPSQRLVMAQTGGGASQVLQHLNTWKGLHPEAAAPAAELSPNLARLLNEEFRRIEAQARLNAEERLREIEEVNEELVREGERLQGDHEGLRAAHEALKAEHAQLVGSHAELKKELERLQQQLDESQRAAEAARVDLAQQRLRADGEAKRADQLYTEFTRLGTVYETEKEKRVDAEKFLASANAALEQVRKHLAQMIERNDEVEADREAVQKSLDAERVERSKVEKQLATSQAEAKAAKERADDLQKREADLRAELVLLRTPAVPANTKGAGKRVED